MPDSFVNRYVVTDPRNLKPGTKVRHKSGSLHTLDRRKHDGSGWTLLEGGGLWDGAWKDQEWTVVGFLEQRSSSQHYEPALRCRRCHHFLMPHDVEGHDKWHDEPRR